MKRTHRAGGRSRARRQMRARQRGERSIDRSRTGQGRGHRHRAARRCAAGQDQCAGVDGGRARVGIDAGKGQCGRSALDQCRMRRRAVLDDAAVGGIPATVIDRQRAGTGASRIVGDHLA